jgi:hypothetical protein
MNKNIEYQSDINLHASLFAPFEIIGRKLGRLATLPVRGNRGGGVSLEPQPGHQGLEGTVGATPPVVIERVLKQMNCV